MTRTYRDWGPIFEDALARGLTPVQLAREQKVNSRAVYSAEETHGVRLVRIRETVQPTFALPFDPAIEEWRPAVGFEGLYEVSNFAAIRVVRTGKLRKTHLNGRRFYWTTNFYKDGRQHHLRLHRVVALAFVSNPDGHPHVNHLDCDKNNNAASNLAWTSFDENFTHGRAAGRSLAALNPNVRRKLTVEDVRTIRARYAAGERLYIIHRDYSHVHNSHFARVAKGKMWQSIGSLKERSDDA